jgi:hypothetical protein
MAEPPLLDQDQPPLLALLGRLALTALQGRLPADGALGVQALELRRNGLTVELEARHLTALVNGRYTVLVRLAETAPERSRCTWQLQQGRIAGRLAGWAVRALPDRWLNGWLEKRVAGITLSGDQVLIEHRPLVRWLLHR